MHAAPRRRNRLLPRRAASPSRGGPAEERSPYASSDRLRTLAVSTLMPGPMVLATVIDLR
jgi:hypothetical protein